MSIKNIICLPFFFVAFVIGAAKPVESSLRANGADPELGGQADCLFNCVDYVSGEEQFTCVDVCANMYPSGVAEAARAGCL